MKHSSIRQKGIGFQQKICEILCNRYDLKTIPLSKKSAGKGIYARENEPGDLLVKGSSKDGGDIIPISEKAKSVWPFVVEAKSVKRTTDTASLLSGKDCLFRGWIEQAEANSLDLVAIVIFKINNSSPIVIFQCQKPDVTTLNNEIPYNYLILRLDDKVYTMMALSDFLDAIDKIRNEEQESKVSAL